MDINRDLVNNFRKWDSQSDGKGGRGEVPQGSDKSYWFMGLHPKQKAAMFQGLFVLGFDFFEPRLSHLNMVS